MRLPVTYPVDVVAEKFVQLARGLYGEGAIPLHRPIFEGNEKKYLLDCIDSNFVSSAGALVQKFEELFCDFTGSKYAVAVVNGTSALHLSLLGAGVKPGTEVITQPLTFVATCNAIRYVGADPLFCDVNKSTFGLCADALQQFLTDHVEVRDGQPINKTSNKVVSACLPMHTFGAPCEIEQIIKTCETFHIPVVEDCAEALGSSVNGIHVGNFGAVSAYSFNGNKIITTGGGGMVVTNSATIADRVRHLSTTAKVHSNDYNFYHDEVGYNYRMPNINAALGCAQIERLHSILEDKRLISTVWTKFFGEFGIQTLQAEKDCQSNAWLNAAIFQDQRERDFFLEYTNSRGIMSRPVWHLMNTLPEFRRCQTGTLETAKWIQNRSVNVPSSARCL